MTIYKSLSNPSPLAIKEPTTKGIDLDLHWLENLIYHRIEQFLKGISSATLADFPLPSLDKDCFYSTFVQAHQMTAQERLVLVTSLACHINLGIFDAFQLKNQQTERLYTQFGGRLEDQGWVPTGETLCFLTGLQSINARTQLLRLFQSDHFFSKKQLLWLSSVETGHPRLSGKLMLSPDYLNFFFFKAREHLYSRHYGSVFH